MFKKIALAAFAVASLSAFAQERNRDWDMKYDTYRIGTTDLGGANGYDLWRVVQHDLKWVSANDAITINRFIDNAPADQSMVIVLAIANNYKQASMVRDEVAQARYGAPADYAWLSYPALTWSATPGQNSWSTLTMADTPAMAMSNGSMDGGEIPMADDSSRPMRMAMRNHGRKDIDYDRALDILGSNLNETQRGTLHEIFHPQAFDPYSYTNESELESLIRVVEANASAIDGLGRYAWYNHFDKDYYNMHRGNW